MLGAIAGDVIGSVYEFKNTKTPAFEPLFDPLAHPTDDTVLTCAVAEWLLRGAGDDLVDRLKIWFCLFPQAGYGGTFIKWAGSSSRSPYNSWGNGSAMRVSPVGWAFDTLDDVLHHARRSAEVTHNHPEGIKGAEATAAAVFLARTGKSKAEIRAFVEERFGYDLKPVAGRYSSDVPVRRVVPGVGPGGDHRVPGVRPTSRTPSGRPSRSAGIRTPSPASPGASPTPPTGCPRTSGTKPNGGWPRRCGQS